MVGGLLDTLDGGNVDLAAEIAAIPEHVRGYGHVKEAHLHNAKAREAELLAQWNNPLRIVPAACRPPAPSPPVGAASPTIVCSENRPAGKGVFQFLLIFVVYCTYKKKKQNE